MKLQIVPAGLLDPYNKHVAQDALSDVFHQLKDAEISTDGFSFYTSVASVYSSKIEGETIELDSYIKHKRFGVEFQPDYTRKIDDLYLALAIFVYNNGAIFTSLCSRSGSHFAP